MYVTAYPSARCLANLLASAKLTHDALALAHELLPVTCPHTLVLIAGRFPVLEGELVRRGWMGISRAMRSVSRFPIFHRCLPVGISRK